MGHIVCECHHKQSYQQHQEHWYIMMNHLLVFTLLCVIAITMVVGKPPHIRDHAGQTINGIFKRAEEYRYRRACNPMQCFQVLMAEVPEYEQMASCNAVNRQLECFQGCSDAQLSAISSGPNGTGLDIKNYIASTAAQMGC